MTVKDLIKKLEAVNENLEVIVDGDSEGGYWNLREVALFLNEKDSDEIFCNLLSSNEI
jgi:hypothetical protein